MNIIQACDQLETKKKENLTTPQATPPELIIKNTYFSTLKYILYCKHTYCPIKNKSSI